MKRLFCIFALSALPAHGDDAAIDEASADRTGDTWTFRVTLQHADTGWDDYADGWRVVTETGEVLGVRELLHPHVNEQPFTRSLSGVAIPDDVRTVFIEANTNTEGWGAARLPVELE